MLTKRRVRELFDYHPSGKLIWKCRNSNRIKIGSFAGCKCWDNYYRVRIDNVLYKNSRVIWLWHHNLSNDSFVDHINNKRDDDRIENLRLTSKIGNAQNFGNRVDNSSNVKGVCWDDSRNKWKVRVNSKCLGRFSDFDDAVLHRLAAEQCLEWLGHNSTSPAFKYAIKNNLIKRVIRE